MTHVICAPPDVFASRACLSRTSVPRLIGPMLSSSTSEIFTCSAGGNTLDTLRYVERCHFLSSTYWHEDKMVERILNVFSSMREDVAAGSSRVQIHLGYFRQVRAAWGSPTFACRHSLTPAYEQPDLWVSRSLRTKPQNTVHNSTRASLVPHKLDVY